MSLLDVVRSGVKIADGITKPLQPSVTYYRYVSSAGDGAETYASGVSLRAIVEWKQRQVRTSNGVMSVSSSSVMFLDTAALVTATGGEGVNDHDKIVLPDGTTGPILALDGFTDAGTGHPVATTVYLG